MRPSLQLFTMRGRALSSSQAAASTTRSIRPLSRFYATTSTLRLPEQKNKNWADPVSRQYKFWNREQDAGKSGRYSFLLEMSPESIQKEAKIMSLSSPSDSANEALHTGTLPLGASLLSVGTTLPELQDDMAKRSSSSKSQSPNVLFVSPSCPRAATMLPLVLAAYPSIEWVHCRSAGIDFVESDEFSQAAQARQLMVTNAKGQFSSSLAEYALMACSYFAKDLPRLMRQKSERQWINYDIEELRGKTMGIIGYGDIGRACAKLATVYGMRIVALRRHPFLSKDDPFCDVTYGRDKGSLNKLMKESDYIVCSTPSTVETRGMVSAEAFEHVKKNAVFINLGRGPVVDEPAMIEALKTGNLKGAALDVFSVEPLPPSSELWGLDNVLLSPHNMDQWSTFMHEATEFFLNENLPRFICGEDLLNPVDPKLGY